MPRPPSTPAPGPEPAPRLGPRLRLALLAGGVGAALLVVALSGSLSATRVRDWVDGFGVAAPVAFVLLSAALTCALFPGPLLAGAAGLLFGTALGFPVSLCAATLGAVCAFTIARQVGYDAVEQLAGPRVRRLRDWVGRRGFYSVLYARLAPAVPYHAVNYAAGLTPVRLPAFAAATALGAAPRSFAYVALGRLLRRLPVVADRRGGGRPRGDGARGRGVVAPRHPRGTATAAKGRRSAVKFGGSAAATSCRACRRAGRP